jgi:hypothetical protein
LLEIDADRRLALPPGGATRLTKPGQFREHGERVDVRPLIERVINFANDFDQRTFGPIDEAIAMAAEAGDAEVMTEITEALREHVRGMRASPAGIHADANYQKWILIFENEVKHCEQLLKELESVDEDLEPMGEAPGDDDYSTAESDDSPSSVEPPPRRDSSLQIEDQALSIVRERYARGEITRDEFLQIQEDLRS